MRAPATCALGKSRAARGLLAALGEAEACCTEESEKMVSFPKWEDNVSGRSWSVSKRHMPNNEFARENMTVSFLGEEEKEVRKRNHRCFMCDNLADDTVCNKCSRYLKTLLLNADLESVASSDKKPLNADLESVGYSDKKPLNADLESVGYSEEQTPFYYCFKCSDLLHEEHDHKDQMIRLGTTISKSVFACVTGNEKWAPLFSGIQAARVQNATPGEAYYLHPPKKRCELCYDLLLPMEDTSLAYCNLECWLRCEAVAVPPNWISALLYEDFGDKNGLSMNSFCINCGSAFHNGGDDHDGHDCLLVTTDSRGPSIEVPVGHAFTKAWKKVQNLAVGDKNSSTRVLRIRDGAPRCNHCKGRLEVVSNQVQRCRICMACVVYTS